MKKLIIALLALAVLVAADCSRPPTPPGPGALDGSAPVVFPDAAPPATADASPPAPPSSVDAGPPAPLTPVGAACANLAALGCSEGSAANCSVTMQHAIDQHLTKVPIDCLTAAKTPAAARACGFVSCKP